LPWLTPDGRLATAAVEEDSVVVVLVVAVAGTPEVEVQGPAVVVSTAVAASKQVGSMVADWSQAELARAAVA
jgi:hypothetical protein